jgi:DNA-binding NarL/FixJ family response regulator
MIRVFCVEDEPMVMQYLMARLGMEADITVVGTADRTDMALAQLTWEEADVVLLDQQLHGATGLKLLEALSAAREGGHRRTPAILFCTGVTDPALWKQARESGAAGIVSKSCMLTELVPAVRAAAAGQTWFSALPGERRRLRMPGGSVTAA